MSLLDSMELTEVNVNFENYMFTILGQPKIGKTTMYKEIVDHIYGTPKAGLFIPFELGYGHIKGMNKLKDKSIYSKWEDFQKLVADLAKNGKKAGIKVVCLDTIDRLLEVAEEYALRKSFDKHKVKADNINDAFKGYGRGKKFVIKEVSDQLKKLRNAGIGIFVIGHTKLKTLKEKVQDEDYQVLGASVTEDYFSIFANDSDFICMITNEAEIEDERVIGSERLIRFRDNGFYQCGSRFGSLPDTIDYDIPAFIASIENAIEEASGLEGEELEKQKAKQESEQDKKREEAGKAEEEEKLQEFKDDLVAHITETKDEMEKGTKKTLMSYMKKYGVKKVTEMMEVISEDDLKELDTAMRV